MLEKSRVATEERIAAISLHPPKDATIEEKLDFFKKSKAAIAVEITNIQKQQATIIGIFNQMTDAVMSQGPHAVALVYVQLVDNELTELIFGHMPGMDRHLDRSLFKGSAPLATFSAKIDLAKSMGIIDSALWSELHRLRKLRNKFAHAHKVLSFEDQVVIDHVNSLAEIHAGLAEFGPKAKFMGAVNVILTMLRERKSVAGGYQRSERDDLN